MVRDNDEYNKRLNLDDLRKEKVNDVIVKFTDHNGNFDYENFKNYIEENGEKVIREGYGLNFLGKRAAELLAGQESTTIFVPDTEHNEKEENKNSENIYISADNLEALRHLKHSYRNKIKCIYIDPPYNTGSDEFCYPDSFNYDKETLPEKLGVSLDEAERILNMESKRTNSHSSWLSFMYARLIIARELLTEDGAIFISIDDNEMANLKLLCDNVFGETEYLGNIIWNKGNAQNDAKNIQKNHEYIIAYIKERKYLNGKEESILLSENIGEEEVYKDEKGKYYCIGAGITTGGAGGTLNNRPNLGYTIYYNKETKDKIAVMDYDITKARTSNKVEEIYKDDKKLIDANYIPIRPPKKGNSLGCWTWDVKKFNKDKDYIYISKELKVYKKIFVHENDIYKNEDNGKLYAKIEKERNNIRSILNYSSGSGTTKMKKLFGHKYFDNPKNLDMLKFLIKSIDDYDYIVLDFFSGSATTAHAILELNAEDGGNRRIISVQLPDNLDEIYEKYNKQITKDQIDLCEKCGYPHTLDYIGIERIKRAAAKIKEETGADIDYGFKHFNLVDRKETLSKLEEFNPGMPLLTQDEILNEYCVESRIITMLCEDGYGLTPKYDVLDLDGYKAYYIDKRLYLVEKDFDSKNIMALLKLMEKEDLVINKVVIFGYAFSTKELQQLKDNAEKIGIDDDKDIIIKY